MEVAEFVKNACAGLEKTDQRVTSMAITLDSDGTVSQAPDANHRLFLNDRNDRLTAGTDDSTD